MDGVAHMGKPVLIGIAPFKSMAMMEWMVKFVPGILVPEEIQTRLKKAKERGGKEEVYKENIEIFGELMREIRKATKAQGIHVMTIGFEWIVPKIIERSGIA